MKMDEIEIIEIDGKQVPVKVEKDAICSGRLELLNKNVVSPEEIRRRIIELANHSGNYIGDGEDLDVSYDVNGNYVVNEITKTPLSYEEALDAYQQSIDIEADIEEKIKEQYRSLKNGSSQEMLDSLREELSKQQDYTEVFARRIEDAYNESHTQEATDIMSYYERYSLSENSTVDEIADKLDEAVEKGLITREGADNVFEVLARIKEIRDEIKDLRQAENDNIERKKLLVNEDGAKEESVRGYDEAVKQIQTRIRNLSDEANQLITNLPPITVESKIAEEPIESKQLPAVINNEKQLPAVIKTKEDIPESSDSNLEDNPTETLEESYNNIVDLRNRLNSINDLQERLRVLKELIEATEKMEETITRKTDLGDFRKAIQEIDDLIAAYEKAEREATSEYAEAYDRIRELMVEQNKALGTEQPLSEEQYRQIYEEYLSKKAKENAKSEAIKSSIEEYRNQLASLKRRKNTLERDLKEAAALGLSASEYREIIDVMRKRNLINTILENKGLKNIVNIPAKDRTKEQQKLLEEARAEIRKEIARHKASTSEDASILDSIEVLYGVDTTAYKVREPRKMPITEKEANNFRNVFNNSNVVKIPRPEGAFNNNKEVLPVPEDMSEVYKKKSENLQSEENEGLIDRITIFTDTNTGRKYARKYVFTRFNIEPQSEEIRINGSTCYAIHDDDLKYITANANNDISPYEVVNVDVEIEKQKQFTNQKANSFSTRKPAQDLIDKLEKIRRKMQEEPIENYAAVKSKTKEKITLYYDMDNDEVYANESVFARFNIINLDESTIINGQKCYRMTPQDALYIDNNKNNEESPYELDVVNVRLGKKRIIPNEPVKNEVIPVEKRKITIYIDKETGNKYVSDDVLDGLAIGYEGDSTIIDRIKTHQIDREAEFFINHFVKGMVNPQFEIIYKEISLKKDAKKTREGNNKEIVLTLYRDLNDNGQIYASSDIISRFGIIPSDKRTRNILGEPCHKINTNIEQYIKAMAREETNPRIRIEYRDVRLRKNNKKVKPQPPEEEITLTLYRDLNDNGQIYASHKVLSSFGITLRDNKSVDILGEKCYKISKDIDREINRYANESRNPKINIRYIDVKLKNKEKPNPNNEIILTLYKDINDNYQIYASQEIIDRFNLINKLSNKTTTDILGDKCYKINKDIDDRINLLASKSTNPKIKIEYLEVKLKKKQEQKKAKPHLEEILDKLTQGLDIKPRDAIKWMNRNQKVLESWKNELHSGVISYNIVATLPSTIKATFRGTTKLIDSIFTTERGRRVTTELKRRIDALTDEELDVLFTEYRGSVLKEDMNLQINPMILPRLKEYGLRKLQRYNDLIRINYEELFRNITSIQGIDERLNEKNLRESEIKTLKETRRDILHKAANNVRTITNTRTEANKLLSGGIHGLEEDFKAVQTKMNYEGKAGPFGFLGMKVHDFDSETQTILAKYGHLLNSGLENDDEQDIVDGFIGLEKTKAENTKLEKKWFGGQKSVGTKYYSPLAEELDYRDDPFLRDFLTTATIITSVVSAINAYRVHEIEQAQYVANKNQEIADVNKLNRDTAANVRQQGAEITSKSDTVKEGMAAQQYEDVLATANTSERASLDLTGWKFNDAYHAADHASHTAYNQFADQVNQRVTDIATRYGHGAITQQDALREMAQLSRDTQSTLNDVITSSLPILRKYAQDHPQFDLHGVEEAMRYLADHPDAISNMNDATLEMLDIGEALKGVTAAEVSALGLLPSDMLSTMIAAATATSMAGRICLTMKDGVRAGKYGNRVTDMMNEYIESQNSREASQGRSR